MDAERLAERIVDETDADDPPEPADVADELRQSGAMADMFRVDADAVVSAYAEALEIREEGDASGYVVSVETHALD